MEETQQIEPPARELTAKEERFVDEYLVDMNASAAARRAGLTKKKATSWTYGWRMLRDVGVSRAITERRKQLSQEIHYTQADAVIQLREIAHKAQDAGMSTDYRAAVSAIDLIAKMLGFVPDKVSARAGENAANVPGGMTLNIFAPGMMIKYNGKGVPEPLVLEQAP